MDVKYHVYLLTAGKTFKLSLDYSTGKDSHLFTLVNCPVQKSGQFLTIIIIFSISSPSKDSEYKNEGNTKTAPKNNKSKNKINKTYKQKQTTNQQSKTETHMQNDEKRNTELRENHKTEPKMPHANKCLSVT